MPLPRVQIHDLGKGNENMCKPRIKRNNEHDNVNFGVINIEDESSNTGPSTWVIIEYITFVIIFLLGAKLLYRLYQMGCRHLEVRQQRLMNSAMGGSQRRYIPEQLEMRQAGGRPPAPYQLTHRPVQGASQVMPNNFINNNPQNYMGGANEGSHDYDGSYEDHRLSPHQAGHHGPQPGLAGAPGLQPNHGPPPGGAY